MESVKEVIPDSVSYGSSTDIDKGLNKIRRFLLKNEILLKAADPMNDFPGFSYDRQDFDSLDDFKLFKKLKQYLKKVGPREHLGNPRVRKTADKHFKYKYIGHVNLHKKEKPKIEPYELTGYHLDPGFKRQTLLPGWRQGSGESNKMNYPLADPKKMANFTPSMRYYIKSRIKIKDKWEQTKMEGKWPQIWPGTNEPSPYDDIYGPQQWYQCSKCKSKCKKSNPLYPVYPWYAGVHTIPLSLPLPRCPSHGIKHKSIIKDVELDFTNNKDHQTPSIEEQQKITIIKDLIIDDSYGKEIKSEIILKTKECCLTPFVNYNKSQLSKIGWLVDSNNNYNPVLLSKKRTRVNYNHKHLKYFLDDITLYNNLFLKKRGKYVSLIIHYEKKGWIHHGLLPESRDQKLQIRDFLSGFKSQAKLDQPYVPGIPKSKKRVNRFPPKPTGYCQYEMKPGEKCGKKLRKHKNKLYCHEHSGMANEDYERGYQRKYKKQHSTYRHQNDLGTKDYPHGPKNKHNKNPSFLRNIYGVEYSSPKPRVGTINFMVTHKNATHETYHKFSLMLARESVNPGYMCPECESHTVRSEYLANIKGSGGVDFVCKNCGLVIDGPHDSRVKYPWGDYGAEKKEWNKRVGMGKYNALIFSPFENQRGNYQSEKKITENRLERERHDSIKLIYKSYDLINKLSKHMKMEIPDKDKKRHLDNNFNPALYI